MRRGRQRPPKPLGAAEQAVMDYVWQHGPASAEQCRDGLRQSWPMKESTMRTVLRRLEAKGYVTHDVEGRTYVYRAAHAPMTVTSRMVKHLIDRFCGGSAEALVLGLVDNAVLTPQDLKRLLKQIADRKEQQS
jgi:predicted transcriptional regulator